MASQVGLVDEYTTEGPISPEAPRTPTPGGRPNDYETLARWVHSGLYQTTPLRLRDVLEWRENELLDQGYQWLRTITGAFGGLTSWIDLFWDSTVDKRMPMPVLNKGLDRRMIESASLGRPNFVPVLRPRGSNPDLRQRVAARKLQSRLRHLLDQQNWTAKNELVALHPPLYGNVWTLSEWEEDYIDVYGAPAEGAMQCTNPECGTIVSKMTRPLSGPSLPGTPEPVLNGCPTCPPGPDGNPVPMQPYTPSPNEALRAKDAFGRPLGRPKPKGCWKLRVVPPDDIFIRNMGLDAEAGKIDDFTYVHIETLDWLRKHYPEQAVGVIPDDPAMLAAWHVIGGTPYTLSMTLGTGLFKDMVRVKERHRGPRMVPTPDGKGLIQDNGRSVVVAGRKVMRDEDYMIPSRTRRGVMIRRCVLDTAQWELRDGGRRIQGLSLWRILRDAQKISNEIIAQTQAVRRTCAVPIWAAAKDSNFELAALKTGLPGYVAEFEIDPGNPSFKPELINNMTIAPGVSTEMGTQDGFMNSIVPAIEGGASTGGVDAAKAMKELKQAAGSKREPRIRRISSMLRRQFRHGAECEQHLDTIPHECKYVNEDGDESYRMFDATDYECEVDIDVEPFEVDADKEREATELLTGNMRVVSANDSPEMKRKLVEIIGGEALAEKLFESEMLQQNAAKREWVNFRDDQPRRVPVVDPTLDNGAVHLEQHARDAESEFFREQKRQCNWDAALDIISVNFQQNLQFLMMLPPDGQIPGAVPQPGQPAPPPMPKSLQARIVFFWGQRLQEAGFVSPDADALAFVLTWRAHLETHRLLEEQKQQMAQQQAVMAAPAGPQTASGTQVHAGAAPRGTAGGPGTGAEGYQAQVDQQRDVRAIAATQKKK